MIDAGQSCALLFTDIVMPDTSGRELSGRVCRLLPNVRVLFTTGYTQNAVVRNGILDPGTNFLGKPFSLDELAAKVAEVLDSPLKWCPWRTKGNALALGMGEARLLPCGTRRRHERFAIACCLTSVSDHLRRPLETSRWAA